MVRIPSEYQEVEYIEGTGEQYIETGIYPQLNDAVDITFFSNEAGDKLRPFGAYLPGVEIDGYKGFRIYTKSTSVYDDSAKSIIGNGKKSNVSCTQDGTWFLDGNAIITDVPILSNSSITITIFKARYINGDLLGNGKMRLFKFAYERSEALIQNLIPCYRKSDNEIGMYDTVSKIFFTNQGTGTFLKGNDVTYDTVNLLESRRRILLNTPHIESASGSVVSFNTDMATNLKECKVHFSPAQEGEGTPSPDNVRPIHGWDGEKVTVTGKNYIDLTTFQLRQVTSTGAIRTGYAPFILPAGTYKVTWENQSTGHNIYAINANNYNTLAYSPGDLEFILTKETNVMIRTTDSSIGEYDYGTVVCAESENTMLSVYFITFPSEAGTVYGGTLDLLSGELVMDRAMVTIDGVNNRVDRNGQTKNTTRAFYDATSPAKAYGVTNVVSDRFCFASEGDNVGMMRGRTALTGVEFFLPHDVPDTVNGVNEWFAQNNTQLVYELANPVTYQLTAQTLKSLRGVNNIWSDAGNTTVKYWTH